MPWTAEKPTAQGLYRAKHKFGFFWIKILEGHNHTSVQLFGREEIVLINEFSEFYGPYELPEKERETQIEI